MELTVNGKRIEIKPGPGEMLADLLRERLGLTGTKIGCNEAECGACTVIVDREPVLACTYPAARAAGREVLTIEGLAQAFIDSRDETFDHLRDSKTVLHPLQQAFIDYGAVQCGFCIPGQLMTAHALLNRVADPAEEQVRQALKDTLCRCAGYPAIIAAIRAAAQAMRDGSDLPDYDLQISDSRHKVVGQVNPRPDSVAKVTGAAIFTDDLAFDGMLHARVKRAGVPHAILQHIDVSRAQALEGVAAVLTAADIPGDRFHGLVIPDLSLIHI